MGTPVLGSISFRMKSIGLKKDAVRVNDYLLPRQEVRTSGIKVSLKWLDCTLTSASRFNFSAFRKSPWRSHGIHHVQHSYGCTEVLTKASIRHWVWWWWGRECCEKPHPLLPLVGSFFSYMLILWHCLPACPLPTAFSETGSSGWTLEQREQ